MESGSLRGKWVVGDGKRKIWRGRSGYVESKTGE